MDVPNYNLIASPMHVYEEDDGLTKQEHEQRRAQQLSRQATRSPFIVGSMDELGQKMARLDKFLSEYAPTKLVCESRMSNRDDVAVATGFRVRSADSTDSAPQRKKVVTEADLQLAAREQRDLNRFAGVFSIHSAVQYVPERVKNIHKISMNAQKPKKERKTVEVSSQPKFVELFAFPGYHSMKMTPLPYGLSAVDICDKICEADRSLQFKPAYAVEFKRLFYSHLSQAILQDMFWWIFLEKFQENKKSQCKFFHRIAHNYVKLLIHLNKHDRYKEPFLQAYPNLISQAVYVTFCEAFPDSYKQFGDDFKEFILGIVFEWLTGCVPTPRKFQTWSHKLEPLGKIREAAMAKTNTDQNATKAKSSADEWLRTIEQMETAAKHQAKVASYGSEPSVLSVPLSKSRRLAVAGRQDGESSGDESSVNEKATRLQSGPTQPVVAAASSVPLPGTAQKPSQDRAGGIGGGTSRGSQAGGRPALAGSLSKMLTPVIEVTSPADFRSEDDEWSRTAPLTVASTAKAPSKGTLPSRLRVAVGRDLVNRHGQARAMSVEHPRESHPACKGPDVVPSLFDVNGQSPLLLHVLKTRGLAYDSGSRVFVQRSEMKNLPPLGTPTYADVMRQAYATLQRIEAGVQSHVEKDAKEQARFVLGQIKEAKLYKEKQQALLCDMKEVKRLSNLLMIDHSTKKAERLERGTKSAAKKDPNAMSMLEQVFEEALQKVELSPRDGGR